MSGTKKSGRGTLDKFDPPRKHYCPEHGLECKPVWVGFKRKIRLVCLEGCSLSKKATVKR